MNTLQVKKYYLLIKVKWQKQAKTIEDFFRKNILNTEAKHEINRIEMVEQEIIRDGVI